MAAKNLLIVESPAKAKTLIKYLGKDFDVYASYGHVRDLAPKKGAVLPDQDFKMQYINIEKNQKHLDIIASKVQRVKNLYLATDPDREGEAIAWHLLEALQTAHALPNDIKIYRITFNQITKEAVLAAIESPRTLNMDLVNAQQARRALDYLVGFNLSPLLWKKIRRGLSAGRVQSPALRLIAERELAIQAFKSQEYWTFTAHASAQKHKFQSQLVKINNKRLGQFEIKNQAEAEALVNNINACCSDRALKVSNIKSSKRSRSPVAPFITSTLQQEAVKKLNFSTQKTMKIAQELYEGLDTGSGSIGLITYMRTDSVTIADSAITEIRAFIKQNYGNDFLSAQKRIYKSSSKNAQEAHEAIRPSSFELAPNLIKNYLNSDQLKLYRLIWQRTIASQMADAQINQTTLELTETTAKQVTSAQYLFLTSGSVLVHPGFLSAYSEAEDEDDPNANQEDQLAFENKLPKVALNDLVSLNDLQAKQHFTEPPPRYTEASLVKALEEHGIGRPSTYANIIATIKNRNYVQLAQKRFIPTDVGEIVNKFLTKYFSKYVDYEFTATLENELDEIANGKQAWVPILTKFWQEFRDLISLTDSNVQRSEVTHEQLDEKCPQCQHQLSIRLGKNGKFIGCTNYPECTYTKALSAEGEEVAKTAELDRDCPKCQSKLQLKRGPYGQFIGCSNYPNCNFIENANKVQNDTTVNCPECKDAVLTQRKSRYGTYFYSCKAYPKCKYAISSEPINQTCPKCKWPILMQKTTKRFGLEIKCPRKECGYKQPNSQQAIQQTIIDADKNS